MWHHKKGTEKHIYIYIHVCVCVRWLGSSTIIYLVPVESLKWVRFLVTGSSGCWNRSERTKHIKCLLISPGNQLNACRPTRNAGLMWIRSLILLVLLASWHHTGNCVVLLHLWLAEIAYISTELRALNAPFKPCQQAVGNAKQFCRRQGFSLLMIRFCGTRNSQEPRSFACFVCCYLDGEFRFFPRSTRTLTHARCFSQFSGGGKSSTTVCFE